MQPIQAGVKQGPGLFEMSDRASTVSLLIFQNRQHAVTGGIAGLLA